MGRHEMAPIDRIPLVGGALPLDFVNTTGGRSQAEPRERLRTYRDLLAWCRRAGVLAPLDVARLQRLAGDHVREAEGVLARVTGIREMLYSVLRSVAEDREPPASAVAALGRLWRADRQRRDLTWDEGRLRLRLVRGNGRLDMMIWPLVESSVELLTSDRVATLRRCAECDWLFLDGTKNGSRTWCKKACGNRVRARRHYARTVRGGVASGPGVGSRSAESPTEKD